MILEEDAAHLRIRVMKEKGIVMDLLKEEIMMISSLVHCQTTEAKEHHNL